MLQCIYNAIDNRVILKQYIRSLETIAQFDYPQAWPGLFEQSIAFVT